MTTLHWIFLFYVFVIIAVMGFRRDPLIPCIIGLLHVGWLFGGSIIKGIQTVFNALIVAGTEFLGIIVVISLIVSMSKVLTELGSDYLIMQPAARLMVNADVAFWVLGISMMVVSWFVWPSPAVALIGGIMLPIAVRAGLPVMGAAMAMNLFGHGAGLSGDFVIQGAPAISAKAAGITTSELISASVPIWAVMTLVATITAYIIIKRDIGLNKEAHAQERLAYEVKEKPQITWVSWFIAILVPAAFILDVAAMLLFDLKGGDATALVGGTAALILALATALRFGMEGLEKITDYVREGFMFGIKIFAPVIIIGGFFFMGKGDLSAQILGEGAPGFLEDAGLALAGAVPLNRVFVAVIELAVGIIVGFDGSGFSPLPLTGSIAATFGQALPDINVPTLAALGQIAGVWTGGGTIIPWGLIPVAAICGVNPIDLARANFWPVVAGFTAATIAAIILM